MKLQKINLTRRITDNDEINERLIGARETLAYDYSGNIYICDAISEIADSATPFYNWELYKATPDLAEWIKQGIEEGIIYIDAKDFSFPRLLMQGYYLLIENDLQKWLEKCLYNRFIEIVENERPEIQNALESVDDIDNEIDALIYIYVNDTGKTFEDFDSDASELIKEVLEN